MHLEEKERPTHPFTFFNLGMTYANRADRAGLGDKSDLERAKRYLHRSIDLAGPHDSTLPQAYSLLVSCHQRLGEERQARYWCDKALDKFPLDDELRFRKAMLYVAKGGPELEYAARLLEDIIARPGPERYNRGALGMGGYSTRNVLADVYFQMGQLKKAEQQWRLAIKEVPDYLPAWQGLADLVRQQQRWDKAEALARELIATVRFEVLGQFVLGDTMRALGRYEEAQRAYERILELQPGHPQALERLRSL